MNNTVDHQPIEISERIQVMDVLRGIALFGIFCMNIEFFNRSLFENGGGIWPGSQGIDYLAAMFVHIFITTKFWVLFSMLFGMGFVVLQVRAQQAGREFNWFFVRRLLALLLFGLAHITFFWTGDILQTYALAGFGLMLFVNVSPKLSLVLGVSLYIMFVFVTLLGGAGLSMMSPEEVVKAVPMLGEMEKLAEASNQVLKNGTYMEAVVQRLKDFAFIFPNALFFLAAALGIFLIGSAILRMGWLHQIEEKRGLYIKILLICAPLAILFTGLSLYVGVDFPEGSNPGKGILAQGMLMLGSLPQALCYCCCC
jgi:uncharacterized protein